MRYLSGIFIVMIISANQCVAYTPPIGIPDPPSVLMDADVDMYVSPAMYNFSLDGRGWQLYPISSITGHPYTHFINAATGDDTNNPYGTEASPRKTLPIDSDQYPNDSSLWLAAGSVIEIHNGTYDPGDLKSLYVQGTSDAPCFIRCTSSGYLGDFRLIVNGSYLVCEDLNAATTTGFQLYFSYVAPPWGGSNHGFDYAIVRNSSFKGTETSGEGTFMYIQGKNASSDPDDNVTNIVVYNNEISYYGDWDLPDPYPAEQPDDSGLYIYYAAENIYVIDNHIHHTGGDSLQIGNESARYTKNIYIGRNEMHDDRENAVDIKEAIDVIVSQNRMYNYEELGRDDDGIAVCGIGQGTLTGGDCAQRVWFLFNLIYNCTNAGINLYDGDLIYAIGNIVHTTGYSGTGYGGIFSHHLTSTNRHYIFFNTTYNCENGLRAELTGNTCNVYWYNNIMHTSPYSGANMYYDDYIARLTMDYNIIYESGGELINRDGTTYTLAQLQSNFSEGMNCSASDPQFVSAGSNFHLQSGSPAENTGYAASVISTAFSDFNTNYGESINVDYDGVTLTSPWSMGAYDNSGVKYLFLWTN